MYVGDEMYQVSKGDVVYVPGDEEHGIWNGIDDSNSEEDGDEGGELRWLYCFAADGFDQIKYRFRAGA